MYDKNIWNYDFEIFKLILINLMKLPAVHYVTSDKMQLRKGNIKIIQENSG
jgi:hypothetical protein